MAEVLVNPVIASTNVVNKKFKFIVLKEVNESLLLADELNGICILRWKGRVDIETASEILTLGAAAVTLKGFEKLLVDRRCLIEFDNEARLWIDDWIKNRARKVSHKVKKLAIINSDESFGNMFNNVFNSIISIVFPLIPMKKFDDGSKALKWLLT